MSRKWIGIVTGTLCVLSSSLIADETVAVPAETAQIVAVEDPAVLGDTTPSDTPKQVGKASADASNTAKRSNAAKYVLAAGAVAIGVAAIILVSRHHGHHHHGGGSSAAHAH